MKNERPAYSTYIQKLIFALALFLATGITSWGQTPGLIIKPAAGGGVSPLDPDGDGYVSKKNGGVQLGFTTPPGNDVIQSEIPYVALVKPDLRGDLLRGPIGGFTEIVGTDEEGNNAILTYTDGVNLFYRFRLSGYAPNSKSYAVLIDTDGKMGFTGPNADPNALSGNPGFEVEIVLHSNFYVVAYLVDGTTTPVQIPGARYPYSTHCQKSIAISTDGDDPDYFYDFYLPFTGLPFTNASLLRYVAVTTMNPNPATGNNALTDIGGAGADTNLDLVLTTLVTAQTPTAPGQEVLERSGCPTITWPLSNGATAVSGTSTEEGGIIKLYVNDVIVGTTPVSNGEWTISNLSGLNGGSSIQATVEGLGKGESSSECNLTFVGYNCSTIPSVVTIDNGDKGVRVSNVSIYPVGTVFTVYDSGGNIWGNDSKPDNNPFTITEEHRTTGTIDIGCGGVGNCMNDGSYYVVAKAPFECESPRAYFCIGGTAGTTTVSPAVNAITPFSSYITGTGGISGATIMIYAADTYIGTKILTVPGSWSVPVSPSLICNTTISAQQIAPGLCLSAPSNVVSVGSFVTSAPAVNVDKCATSITTVNGFSGESEGTTIEVFVNGTTRGTTTVTNGAWSLSTTAISIGQPITARAINTSGCKTVSALSPSVSLVGRTALSGTFSIASVVSEGAASVPVTVSGTSGTYTLNLYIDGDKIGSASFSANGIVNVPVTFLSDIYTGGELTVSLTSLAQCESLPTGPLATVQCKMPNFVSSIIDAAVTDKCITTSGLITVTNSQLMVIYTPVNDMGEVTGYSALGNGATITLSTFPLSVRGPSTFYVKAQGIGSSVSCSTTSSESVPFNGYSSPQFTTQPVDQTVCKGTGITSTTSWTGTGPYNVQWQYDSGTGWFNLSEGPIFSQTIATGTSDTSSTLTINDVTFLDQYLFRCIVTDLGIPAECRVSTSNTSLLNVISVTISSAMITNATSGSNGAIDITVSGGNGPYMYDWHHLDEAGTFGFIEDLTGLAGGVYSVTVRDSNGCTHTQTMTVGGVGSINVASVSQTNITCYGANNGELEVIATEGTGPYTYSINNLTPQSSGIFTGLAPGIYTVRAKDSNQAESNTVIVTITEPMEMVVSAIVSNPSVVLNDASVNITLAGGTTPVTYSLYKAPSLLISTVTDSELRNLSFSNLVSGTYYIEVTDANDCFASKENIVLANPIVTTDDCEKVATHSFNSPQDNYSGYDGSYNFFSPNVWTETNDLSNRIQIQEEALAFGLIPAYNGSGNNTVTLTGNPSISRSIDLTGVSPATVTVSFKYTIRYPSANDDYGVRLYVNNEISPFYLHQASGTAKSASFTLSSAEVNFISGINTFKFELYQPGNKFQAQSNFLLDDFAILFSKTITTAITTTPSTCGHGTIDLSVVGGYPPYTYTSDLPIDAAGSFTSTKTWQDLEDGIYHITITDALNCATSQKTVVIDSAPLVGAITEATDPTCLGGGSNGTLTATLSELGTGGPYTYDLFKASVLISSFVSAGTFKTFTGLAPGSYFVKITQGNGNCKTQTSSVTLSLPSLTSSISSTGATTICSGSGTTVAVTVTGGTAPYSVTLSNGLIINNYTSGTDITVIPYNIDVVTVTSVTDANICESSSNTGSVAITVTPMPVATFDYFDSPYCSNNANPSPTFNGGGVAGLFSSTSGLVFVSTTTGQIDLLASTPGTYIITNTITGGGGCGIVTATSPVTIFTDGSWTGAINTDWNNVGNWACNQVPTLSTNVTIAGGKLNYPVISSAPSGTCNNLTIENGASVTVTGGILQIAGFLSNGGSFTASEGTIEMKGTAAQIIGSNVFAGNMIMNLTVDNPAGATLLGALNVTGIVTALNGNLTSGGNLTLVSTATQTALIDGIGTGNVLGDVNVQRYLPSAFGYKYVSSPFQSATVDELSEEVALGATFPSFYKYDENNNIDSSGVTVYKSGWVKYNLAANALVPMAGYAANLGADIAAPALTANMTGEVSNGNLEVNLNNHNRKYTKGFNLVGNPYPSPIDWDSPSWTKTNIDNAVYFFNASGDQYSGTYSSYVNGISTGNGSNVIAAMQGFFVHVSDDSYPVSGTLGVTNSVRINHLNPVFKRAVIDNRSTLRLTASFEHKNAMEDAAIIYFDKAASLDFDQDMDALKMSNTDQLVPNIYSLTPELNQLSINGMQLPSDDISKVPLGITTFTDGWVTLTAVDISRLPADLHLYLLDAETGVQRNLKQVPDYRFHLKSGQYNGRFSLVLSQSELSERVGIPGKLFTLLRSGDYLQVKANLLDNTRGTLMVTNLLGQVILRREVNGNETLEINPTVHTGVYVITLVSGKLKHSEKAIMRKDYE